MEDLKCYKCEASIAVSVHPGVFSCGHMLCRGCGLGVRCPVDGSQCIWNEVDIAMAIVEIKQAYSQVIRQNDSDWSLYYTAVKQLKDLMQRKYSANQPSQAAVFSPSYTSLPQPVPRYSLSASGLCMDCGSFPAPHSDPMSVASSETWTCSICSSVNTDSVYICEVCSGHRLLRTETKKHWNCGHCGYKYNSQQLQECANCHASK